MDMELRGKRVLVTGGSKGIGLHCGLAFAAEGCDVILASRDGAALEAAAGQIRGRHNVNVAVHAGDLSKRADRVALHAAHPDIDILVNNAGAIPSGRLQDIPMARWKQAWDLKVFGYINMCRAYFRMMKARGSGVIVNILGNGGERLDAGYIAGGAGNASLMAFTRALGGNSAEVGVRVVGVNPGPVATERLVALMQKEARTRLGDAGRWQELGASFPFGRPATVDEIAATVVLLASDRSSYTTGTIVTIDGGMANRGSLI
jgi:NAD(P)-dependent dehydrogenase (short-subunit alcohol dehydrogenase family)